MSELDNANHVDRLIQVLELSELPWFLQLNGLYEGLKSSLKSIEFTNPILARLAVRIEMARDRISEATAPLFNLSEGKDLENKIDELITSLTVKIDQSKDSFRLLLASNLRNLNTSIAAHYEKFSLSAEKTINTITSKINSTENPVGEEKRHASSAIEKIRVYSIDMKKQILSKSSQLVENSKKLVNATISAAQNRIKQNFELIQEVAVSSSISLLQKAKPYVHGAVGFSKPLVVQAIEISKPYVESAVPYYQPIVAKAITAQELLEKNETVGPYVVSAITKAREVLHSIHLYHSCL